MTRLGGREKTGEGLGSLGVGKSGAVTALDLGASKVACFIMTPDGVRRADQTVRVAYMGHVQSRGLRGGALVDLEQAADAVSHAVQRAERDHADAVSGAVVTTAIGQQYGHRIATSVSLGARAIRDSDLFRAIASALGRVTPVNRPERSSASANHAMSS